MSHDDIIALAILAVMALLLIIPMVLYWRIYCNTKETNKLIIDNLVNAHMAKLEKEVMDEIKKNKQ